MRKLLRAETHSGDFETSTTAFVATDHQSALAYLRNTRPEIDWELMERPSRKHIPGGKNTELFIAPKNAPQGSDSRGTDRYELYEVDFAESPAAASTAVR